MVTNHDSSKLLFFIYNSASTENYHSRTPSKTTHGECKYQLLSFAVTHLLQSILNTFIPYQGIARALIVRIMILSR